MKINFDEVPFITIPNFQNGDGEIVAKMMADDKNRIMYGILKPGCSIGMHKHETSSEILFVLKGTAKIICDNEIEFVHEGECHYCKMGSSHCCYNNGNVDLVVYVVVPQQE